MDSCLLEGGMAQRRRASRTRGLARAAAHAVVLSAFLWSGSTPKARAGDTPEQPHRLHERSDLHTPEWATVLDWEPDPDIVRDVETRRRIAATGAPWRVLHQPSGVELLLVPAGSYQRGAGPDDPYDRENERPRHATEITQPFYLGRYEVTNAQMRRFRPEHTSGTFYRDESLTLDEGDMPAVDVSWLDAVAFAEHFDLRLPTEAEWEYAARAGVETRYPWGNDPEAGAGWGNGFNEAVKAVIPEMDWDAFGWDDGFVVSSPAGSFRPNAWGFYDLFGNAWEWCQDVFREKQYESWALGTIDPVARGDETDRRTLRGGGWGNAPRGSGIPYRFGMDPADRFDGNGFRVARSLVSDRPLRRVAAPSRRLTDWPGSENGAEFSPDGEWIVFDAVVAGQADIFLLRLATGTTRQLTDTPELDRQPTFSPDGSSVAFESVRDGVRGIWSIPVDGGEAKPLFLRPGVTPLGPDYSDNGDLVFTVIEPDPSVTYGFVTPWVLPADGGEPRAVTRGGDEWWARWGPRGQWLYYFLGYSDHLEAVHVATGEVRPVTRGLHRGWRPAPSPDGGIAFLSNPDNSLWLQADRPGAEPVQLTRGIGGDDRPSFSPDGRSLVFSSDRSRSEVVALDLPSGERTRIGEGRRPQPLADGSVVFLTEEGDDSVLRIASPGEPRARRLELPIRGIQRFQVASDRSAVALTANGGGPLINMDLHVGALDGSDFRRLTRLPISGADSPVWCTRRHVAYTSYKQDLAFRQVFLIDVESGETTTLTDSDSSKRLIDCADDGALLTFRLVADKSGVYSARRKAEGEAFVERLEVDAREGSLSPDATRLAYVDTRDGRTDVFLREADGRTVRLTDDALVEAGVRWRPDGSGIVFSARSPNRDLWLMTLPDDL